MAPRCTPLRGLAALLLLLGSATASADEPVSAVPTVVYDATLAPDAPGGARPKSQGLEASPADVAGRPAVALTVPDGLAWARLWFDTVPTDVRPFAHLDLETRDFGAPAAWVSLRLTDADEKEAILRVQGWKPAWETRRLDLGDFEAEPGFDPARVETLSVVWMKPKAAPAALAKVTLVPGPGGWRHAPGELVKRIFGAKRAPSVKHEGTAHFDVYSDSPKVLKPLASSLEADAKAIAFLLDVPSGEAAGGLAGWRLPVYAFKSAGDYGDYCIRAFGWTVEEAQRSPVVGSGSTLVLLASGSSSPERIRRVARALFAHAYGDGGGAWLQHGVGEYCVRKLTNRPVSQEFAPRARTGDHWPLARLITSSKLHADTGLKSAGGDHLPVYLHAASVLEYLVTEPPPGADDAREAIHARLLALARVRTTGDARLADVEKVLGSPAAEFETAWKRWATGTSK